MKRKNFIGILALSLSMFPLTSYAADIDSMTLDELKEAYLVLEEKYNTLLKNSETEMPESSDSEFIYSAEGFTYKYLKNEVLNIDGTDYVYVFFEYTNDSGETAMPYYSLSVQAFQGGIQIDPYMSFDESIKEAEIAYKDIKTGTTTDVAFKFEITDDSPVSIEVSPMFIVGDVEIGEYTFELNR